MTLPLLRRSLAHYWRTHLGVVLGAALATLVLTGALMVGDSVKATLRAQAEARVGKVGEALLCGERFVGWPREPEKRPAVVARMFYPGPDAAGVLLMQGVAAKPDGSARANRVQIVGVDDAFWRLSPSGRALMDTTDKMDAAKPEGVHPIHDVSTVHLNERLAQQLGATAGTEVILRLEKPGAFSKDAPLSGEEEDVVSFRVRVARVVGDADFGRFALTSGQVPPFTAFVPLAALQEKSGIGEKVNVVLRKSPPEPFEPSMHRRWLNLLEDFGLRHRARVNSTSNLQELRDIDAITEDITSGRAIAAFDITVRELATGGFELRTPRVFLDSPIVAAARKNESTPAVDYKAQANPIPGGGNANADLPGNDAVNPPPGLDSLTYFVNELRLGDGTDPSAPARAYSMVTAIDAPASGFVQAELADDEIQITRWLADKLTAKPGDKVTIKYFAMGERRQLVEKARTFTVLAPIIEMDEPRLDSSWMPDFPGLADKESCRDWKPGFDFDPSRMDDEDQAYWEKYRGTPKAFINLKVGQEMWSNRWGSLTSIRYPAGTKREQVERIAAFIEPEALGFRVANLRADALAATDAPVDFGQLFVSFSFFLIAAAAVLTGLLFTFSIEQRASEAGLLLAIGWRRRQVRRLFIKEGALLAFIGSLAGAAAAALYTKGVLAALAGAWSGASGGTSFLFAPSAATLAIGIASGIVTALLAMWLASRRLFKKEAGALLAGEVLDESRSESRKSPAGSEKSRASSAESRVGFPKYAEQSIETSEKGGVIQQKTTGAGGGDQKETAPTEGRFSTALNPGGVPEHDAPSVSDATPGDPAGSQVGWMPPLLAQATNVRSAEDRSTTVPAVGQTGVPPVSDAAAGRTPAAPTGEAPVLHSVGDRSYPRPVALVVLLEMLVPAIAVIAVMVFGLIVRSVSPTAFFGIGFALLILGVWSARRILIRASFSTAMQTAADLALRNTTRRRGRSLATIAVLASGVFMVVAVDSFRKDTDTDATRRDSGTGGFALVGESASPIYEDLNSEKGREQYALDEKIMAGVRVVQMRVRDGDDASCLNLNRAMQPRVIGANFNDLAGDVSPGSAGLKPALPEHGARFSLAWQTVSAKDATAIPGVVDANTLQWAMQKKVGSILEIPGERGKPVHIEVAATVPASILQGMVFVPESRFIESFPNEAGYRFFLVDCPPDRAQAVREHLTRQLGDRGLELIPAAQRLAEFNAVENTYLSIFQVLGGLGMLLGSAGLGIVVARNVLERRREFGLLEAVGFTPRQLRALVFAEHRWLIAGALVIGAASALVAVWPQLTQKGAALPWAQLAILFGGVAVIGIACAWVATRIALRGSQLGGLRSE